MTAGSCALPGNATPVFTRDRDGAPTYARGRTWPAWFILAIPFTAVLVPLYHAARRFVSWKAALLTLAAFELIMLPVEHGSLMRGHWVYNEHRILGPRIWGIPVEEPLLYYSLPPLLVILLFEYLAALTRGAIVLGAHTRHALRGRRVYSWRRIPRIATVGLASLVAPLTVASQFTPQPVQHIVGGWVERYVDRHWSDHVVLRYEVFPGRDEVRAYNCGALTARHVTLELTLAGPVDAARLAVHVPRRTETATLAPAEDGGTVVAVRADRLFPRSASRADEDEEYLSIRAGARILKVQFVSDEVQGTGTGAPAAEAGELALPPAPVAALP